jgi:hypothetical protein
VLAASQAAAPTAQLEYHSKEGTGSVEFLIVIDGLVVALTTIFDIGADYMY